MRVNFPRGKTGIGRNLVLWPETVETLKEISKNGELVFHTAQGNLWVRAIEGVDKYGNKKFTKEDAVRKR